jgi:hypothetical protein
MRMPGLFSRFSFAVMVGLALWVVAVAAVIEFQNARADYYLPRRDRHDGKWRISMEDAPRDRLRGLVGGVGLFQYLICPLVAMLAVYHAMHAAVRSRRILSITAGVAAFVVGALTLYRDYIGSLGW